MAGQVGSRPFDPVAYSRYKYGSIAAADAFARAQGVRLAIVSNAARHSGHLLDVFGFRDRVDATAGDHELQGPALGLRTVLIERDLPHTESGRADADLCCASLAEAAQALLTS
jgi:hypothetical protein